MTKSRKEFYSIREQEGYYKGAKREKVRARSYFKLEQLDKKFNLINEGMKIIDLGAAPGGWLEYMDKKLNLGEIIGIDLLEIKKINEYSDKVFVIEDDFNNISEYELGEFDLVLSDMAPEFSGDSRADRGRCHKLNLMTIEFCKDNLKTGGNLAFKTFEGEDLGFVRNKAKEIFETVKDYKPKSSQKKSAEAFIVCLNKK